MTHGCWLGNAKTQWDMAGGGEGGSRGGKSYLACGEFEGSGHILSPRG